MTLSHLQSTSLLYDNSTYHLLETPHTTRLVEDFIGQERVVGEVRGWRRHLLSKVDEHFQDVDNRERGYRLFLSIKVLNELRSSKDSFMYLKLMKQMSLEEVIFWVWQYHSYGRPAVIGLKAMHLHNR